MPWVAIHKRGRRPGPLARWRANHREPLFGWTVGAVLLLVVLGALFLAAHKVA